MRMMFLLLVLAVSAASRASAEPITALYTVNVTERCFAAGCEAFRAVFPLMLSFDSGVTFENQSGTTLVRTYGMPTFSPVPLDRPDPSPLAAESARTLELAAFVDPGLWRHIGEVQHRFEYTEDGVRHVWHLGLHTIQDGLAEPELSADELPAFLAAQNGSNVSSEFRYVFSRSTPQGQWLSGSVGYSGTVSLTDSPAPIPEPATLTLMAGGMLALARRVHRRSRRTTTPRPDNVA